MTRGPRRAPALRSAYPQRRSGKGRRAPKTERKVLGRAECSSHASRYRIPQRSRREHSGRFLLAPGAGPAHCACSVRRAAPSPGSRGAAVTPGFAWNPTGRGRRGPQASPARASGRAGVWAGSCGSPATRLFQAWGVPAGSHRAHRGGRRGESGLSVCKGQGLTDTGRAQRAVFAESPPLAVALSRAGVRTKPAEQAASQQTILRWARGPRAPSRAQWGPWRKLAAPPRSRRR